MTPTLEILQKKLAGKITEKLSPQNVLSLFSLPSGPLFNLYLYTSIKNGAIDSNTALLSAINRANPGQINLLAIAFCLRLGANPNFYVNDPQGGTIHLLGYIHRYYNEREKQSEQVIELILLLLLRGSDPSRPIFDSSAGLITKDKPEPRMFVFDEPESKIDISTTPISQPTVIEWLQNQNYPNIFEKISTSDEVMKSLEPFYIKKFSILLNKPELVLTSNKVLTFEGEDIILAIESWAHDTYSHIPLYTAQTYPDYVTIDLSVKNFNYDSFMYFLSKGQEPSYLCVNTLLYGIVNPPDKIDAPETTYSLVIEVYEKILSKVIEIGTQFDVKQYGLLELVRNDVQRNLKNKYDQPYWVKTCSYQANPRVPKALSRLALSLDINPLTSKESICEEIKKISAYDVSIIKNAAEKRRKAVIGGELFNFTDFIADRLPEIRFQNQAFFDKNSPFDFNNNEVVVYRDPQGVYWAFTSDQFPGLLEGKRNPSTGRELPADVLNSMRTKLEVLAQIGINAEYPFQAPKTISQAISELSLPDGKDQIDSERHYLRFINQGARYGIPSDLLTSLTPAQLETALKAVGVTVDFKPYSKQHALVTTAFIVMGMKNNQAFFTRVNSVAAGV